MFTDAYPPVFLCVMTTPTTIEQARKTQEAQVERLRKLQGDKQAAAPERKEKIQQEIDSLDREIRDLDTVIQTLLSQRR